MTLDETIKHYEEMIISKRNEDNEEYKQLIKWLKELQEYKENDNYKETLKSSTWKSFQDTGLLWGINSILHLFGWCICLELDEDKNITNAYPSKTIFRGFSEDCNTRNYEKITKYMVENSNKLLRAFNDENK